MLGKPRHQMDMCHGSLADKIIKFAIPLMASSILQLLFNAADVIVVGRFAGKESLAAVGSTTSLINMLEAVSESLGRGARLSRTLSVLIVGSVTFAVGVFLEALPSMGAWMDAVTIYIAPFGAVLAAVILYWVLGLPAVKAELALGRKRPLGRGFDFLSKYVYGLRHPLRRDRIKS